MTNARTQSNIAHRNFVPGTSRSQRSLHTLALQMAEQIAEEANQRKKEIGARIKELRGPVPQHVVADQVGVTLRAYQAWEAGGGIGWDNLEKLAEVLEASTEFILHGPAGRASPGTQLERLERKIDAVMAHLGLDPVAFDPSSAAAEIEDAAADATRLLEGGDDESQPTD